MTMMIARARFWKRFAVALLAIVLGIGALIAVTVGLLLLHDHHFPIADSVGVASVLGFAALLAYIATKNKDAREREEQR